LTCAAAASTPSPPGLAGPGLSGCDRSADSARDCAAAKRAQAYRPEPTAAVARTGAAAVVSSVSGAVAGAAAALASLRVQVPGSSVALSPQPIPSAPR